MGNTAIIKAQGEKVGLYLHWNGGVDSVTAFLKYCDLRGYRGFPDSYALARLAQVCGNFFGGTLCVGVEAMSGADTEHDARWLDNGIYIVKGWEIVNRIGHSCEREGYDLRDLLETIDKTQPAREQLGKEFLNAEVSRREELRIGDAVFVRLGSDDNYEKCEVVAINKDGFPLIGEYGEGNPNNILREESYRVMRCNPSEDELETEQDV